MTYIINLIKSIFMMIESYKLGQNVKDVKKVIKFLSTKQKTLVVNIYEYDGSNHLTKDIRRYINKYGSGVGIVRDVQIIHKEKGDNIKITKLKLSKQCKNHRDLLYIALEPYLDTIRDDSKIIPISRHKERRIALAI